MDASEITGLPGDTRLKTTRQLILIGERLAGRGQGHLTLGDDRSDHAGRVFTGKCVGQRVGPAIGKGNGQLGRISEKDEPQ